LIGVDPNGITAKKICDENGLMFWPLKKMKRFTENK
jgi:hypothetical protein